MLRFSGLRPWNLSQVWSIVILFVNERLRLVSASNTPHSLSIDKRTVFRHNGSPHPSGWDVSQTFSHIGNMKYLTLIILFLVIYYVIGEFVIKDRSSEGLTNASDKWRDLGSRIHQSVGIIAVLMIVILVIRFIYHTIDSYWRM